MRVKFIEATNKQGDGVNWGKFMIARFTEEEWERRSKVGGHPMLQERGWTKDHLLVLDLQTGEGAIFRPGGSVHYDLNDKHRIWVCPLFEPFLKWLYGQDLQSITVLPDTVDLRAPGSFAGYRREGKHITT